MCTGSAGSRQPPCLRKETASPQRHPSAATAGRSATFSVSLRQLPLSPIMDPTALSLALSALLFATVLSQFTGWGAEPQPATEECPGPVPSFCRLGHCPPGRCCVLIGGDGVGCLPATAPPATTHPAPTPTPNPHPDGNPPPGTGVCPGPLIPGCEGASCGFCCGRREDGGVGCLSDWPGQTPPPWSKPRNEATPAPKGPKCPRPAPRQCWRMLCPAGTCCGRTGNGQVGCIGINSESPPEPKRPGWRW